MVISLTKYDSYGIGISSPAHKKGGKAELGDCAKFPPKPHEPQFGHPAYAPPTRAAEEEVKI